MRTKSLVFVCVLSLVIGLALPFLILCETAYAAEWGQAADDGISGGFEPASNEVSSMAIFGGDLYVGAEGYGDGCAIWHYDGSDWTKVGADGFGDSNNAFAKSMYVFGGRLYVGTDNTNTGCEVWRYDGSNWTCVVGPGAVVASGFGVGSANSTASSMCVFGGELYVGTENSATGCAVYRSANGTAWLQSAANGFGTANNTRLSSMAVFNNSLYVGTDNANGCELLRTPDGIGWGQVDGGLLGAANTGALSMAVFGSDIYVGTRKAGGCEIWRAPDGLAWVRVDGGLLGATNSEVASMDVYGTDIYVGTQSTNGCEIWRSGNGTAWTQSGASGFGDRNNNRASSMTDDGTNLYVGTYHVWDTCSVWSYNGTAWSRISEYGFAPNDNGEVSCMLANSGRLYLGTYSMTGCEVWSYDGSAWTQLETAGFGSTYNISARALAMYGGDLYAGTLNLETGCEVWRYDGSAWTQVNTDGFGGFDNFDANSMAVFQGKLYAATSNSLNGCEVWAYDGSSWTSAAAGGFGDANNKAAAAAVVYGSKLYVGTQNEVDGCELWGYNGSAWTQVNASGFGSSVNRYILSLVEYDGALYAGTYNKGPGCQVWRTAGTGGPPYTDWTQVNTDGFGDVNNTNAQSMATYGGRLYVGTSNDPMFGGTGCEVWSTSGVGGPPYTDWIQENTDGFGDVNNARAVSMVGYFSGLYVGTMNWTEGCQIWNTPAAWYLAEGATRGGFETWVLVQNPGADPVHVDFTLNTDTGEKKPEMLQGIAIPPGSRVSFNMGLFETTFDLSTRVAGRDGNVICERAMYWTPEGQPYRELGHDSIGVNSADSVWYLAEGATRGGFETWVLVQNPGADPVHVDFTLNTDTGEKKPEMLQGISIPARSRVSFNMGLFETTYDLSTKVEARDGEVICERAMYWTPEGETSRRLGHDSIGVNYADSVWYLAEGATLGGFETWVLVQNPGADPVHVDFTLNTDTGVKNPPELQGVEIPAGSRRSFNMGNYEQTFDLSTKVDCTDGQVICERAMYWTPAGQPYRELGHDSVGVNSSSAVWYLAEGATMGGFETWVLVQNPGADPVHVDFTLNTDTGEKKPEMLQGIAIPPGSRVSFNMGLFETTFDLSTRVTARDGLIICERAMYWTPEGGIFRELGHDSIGYSP